MLFICHLADQKDRYSVDFEDLHGLGEAIPELIRTVRVDPKSEEARSRLLEVLIQIIEFRGSLGKSAESQYIVFHFLALRHLRQDGGFPPPIDVTQTLAHLQWCFRLVMFSKVLKKMEDRTSQREDQRAAGGTR